jgi:hypothetical protein
MCGDFHPLKELYTMPWGLGLLKLNLKQLAWADEFSSNRMTFVSKLVVIQLPSI